MAEDKTPRHLFRKASLERLSSPEQLDQLMRITTPAGWVTVIGIGMLVVAAVVWGIWSSIPTKVEGSGILMHKGGVYTITARASGRVKNLYFSQGDKVQAGQIVAMVGQLDIVNKILNTKEKIDELEETYRITKEFSDTNVALEKRSLAQQKANFEMTNAALKDILKLLDERLVEQKHLVKLGLLTKQNVIATQESINQSKQQVRQNENSMKQLGIKQLQLENQARQKLINLEDQIANQRAILLDLQASLSEDSAVVSPYTGNIVSLDVDLGGIVQMGSPLMTIELMSSHARFLESIMYFPADQGKRIYPGMKAQVSPSTVKKDKYGSIIGLVTFVSTFPSNPQDMNRVLQNQDLVNSLTAGGAPVEVRVALVPCPKTFSGYKWTSSSGPPVHVQAGTVNTGSVVVLRQPPYQLVVPLMKKYLLGVGEQVPEGF